MTVCGRAKDLFLDLPYHQPGGVTVLRQQQQQQQLQQQQQQQQHTAAYLLFAFERLLDFYKILMSCITRQLVEL
jgi:hypothetical protein